MPWPMNFDTTSESLTGQMQGALVQEGWDIPG